MRAPSILPLHIFEKRPPAEAGSLYLSGLPRGCKPPELDPQNLNFSVQAQFVLLQPENVLVKGYAARRVFLKQQFFDLGLSFVLFSFEPGDFLFDGLNLL
ncbi:hypothetical protein [Desulfomicrobium baculatum]|uniref:hypothetical protein n=1 Tax=Desulfomicrobium baculatum TaxID=899 RepID=UPI001427A5B8|nr:hypothetical protein [Desulfomicrobium baculatum]